MATSTVAGSSNHVLSRLTIIPRVPLAISSATKSLFPRFRSLPPKRPSVQLICTATELAERTVDQLLAADVKVRDPVALAFSNTDELAIMLSAVKRVGAMEVLLNNIGSLDDIKHALSANKPKLLLTPKEGIELAQAAAAELNIPHINLYSSVLNIKSGVEGHNMGIDGWPDGAEEIVVKYCRPGDPTHGVPWVTSAPITLSNIPEEVRLDIPGVYIKQDGSVCALSKNLVQEKGQQRTISGPVGEYVERVGGWLFPNSLGSSWAGHVVQGIKVAGFGLSTASYALQESNEKLARFLHKIGAIATATVVIWSLAMPLPTEAAWAVGLTAWLFVVAIILCN